MMKTLQAIAVSVALLATVPALGATLTRGPYLQLPGEQQMTVVWQSDTATDSVVRYGAAPDQLNKEVKLSASDTTHVVPITGLGAASKYFYSIGSTSQTLATGAEYYFRTHPPVGQPRPFRFFAWGDSGNQTTAQFNVAGQMDKQVWHPDFALILGDIIYPGGEPWNYDPAFFKPYASMTRNTVIWPAIGNHDVIYNKGQPYFDNFYLPRNNPGNLENYYSFDYANAHFVCLDSQNGIADPAFMATMLAWLDKDLAASTATFKFAYFHHPPYSGGTHPDDATVKSMINPVLEKYGVDLVLTGHSHVYERSWLLKGNQILQKDPANYSKIATPDGTLYLVTGAGGENGSLANATHPLMALQKGNVNGSTIIDVDGKTLHGFYLLADGSSIDLFRITKDGDKDPPQVTAFRAGPANTQLTVVFSEPVAAGTNPGGAERVGAYVISPSVAISSARLSSDGRTVTLTTAAHPNGLYTLVLGGIQDRMPSPNAMSQVSLNYTFGPVAPPGPDAGTPPGADAGPGPAKDAGQVAGADGGVPDADGVRTPPYAEEASPAPGSALVTAPVGASVHIKDDSGGVAASAIRLKVDGVAVNPEISGSAQNQLVTWRGPFKTGTTTLEVSATNLRGTAMAPFSWSFTLGAPQAIDASTDPASDAGLSTPPADSTVGKACGCGASGGEAPVIASAVFAAILMARRRRGF